MNITISLPHFTHPGGTNNAMLGLSQGLIHAGVGVEVLCESDTSQQDQHQGVPFIMFDKPRRKSPFAVSSALLNYIEENKESIDLFIVNGCFFPYAFTLARHLIRHRIPYLFLPHDPYNKWIFNQRAYLKYPYFYLFEKYLIENAAAVQTLSVKHNKYLRRHTRQRQIISLANGIFTSDEPAQITHKANAKGPVRGIFMGRMDTYNKGLDLLLHAVKQLNSQGHEAGFELVLKGPDNQDVQRLKQLAKQLQLTRIRFEPPDFTKSSLEILSGYDFFILPSRFEGFSLAAAEAMLAGLPVIASEEAGIAEHVEKANAGILCTPDVNSISRAIEAMLEKQSQWQSMGDNGRHYLQTHLTWEKIGQQAKTAYLQLLSSPQEVQLSSR